MLLQENLLSLLQQVNLVSVSYSENLMLSYVHHRQSADNSGPEELVVLWRVLGPGLPACLLCS